MDLLTKGTSNGAPIANFNGSPKQPKFLLLPSSNGYGTFWREYDLSTGKLLKPKSERHRSRAGDRKNRENQTRRIEGMIFYE